MYKDLIQLQRLTSVKFHVAGSTIAFLRPSYRTTFFIGMALLNAILLQMFRNKINISPPVLPISSAKHLKTYKNMCFICSHEEHISDNTTNNNDGIGRCDMDLKQIL